MSPTSTPSLNPSFTVERIREIIVGRQLEKLESRVAHIEASGASAEMPSHWEGRLCTIEARLEALQHSAQRVHQFVHEEFSLRNFQQREEIQRLVAQIQQVAAQNSANDPQTAIRHLERRIGAWLKEWQTALQTHLNERETRLISRIRGDVTTLLEGTEAKFNRPQSRTTDPEINEERFRRIAAAARALAECAAPLPSGNDCAPP